MNNKLPTLARAVCLAFVLIVAGNQSFSQTPFSCTDGVSYQINGNPSSLYSVNLRTGAKTLLFSAAALGNRNLTGLGYNPKDNFLYASISGTKDILRIGANGVTQQLTVPGLPADTYEAGDVGPDGTLYLYSSSATKVYKVNLSNLAVTTITLTAGSILPDISISPDGTRFYGISNVSGGSGNLISYSTNGGAATSVDVGSGPFSYSAFMDKTGDLFLMSDFNSIVYEVPGPSFATSANNSASTTQISTVTSASATNTDGARCVNSLATTQPVFTCAPNDAFISTTTQGYVNNGNCSVQANGKSTLLEYNLSTGGVTNTSTQLINDYNGRTTINNLGYNPTDNYLWAYRNGTNQLVRIGTDRSVDYFAIPGLPDDCGDGTVPNNTNFGSGDINSAGVMYLLNGADGDRMIRVDLNPTSPTYLKKLSDVVLTPFSPANGGLANIADIAFNPVDNMLYTVSAANNLFRINPTSGLITNLGHVTGISSNASGYLAAYFDNSGTLYVKGSAAPIYKIPNVAGGGLTGSLFSNGPVMGSGDGARCPYNVVDPPMPVSLVSFTAQAQADHSVLLTWTTSWERANKAYTIERSKDLISFETVGEVTDVAGTSNSLSTYRFVDNAPYRGTSYYRLRQLDGDGSSQTFKAEAVVVEGGYGVHPNPVTGQSFTLSLDEPTGAVLRLYSASGQELKLERKAITEQSVQLVPATKLPAGVYILRVEERATKREYRLVIP